jgi:hypothetical protein
MRGRLGIASSTMLSLTHRLLRIIREIAPHRAIGQELMPVENQPKISAIRSADCFSLGPSRPAPESPGSVSIPRGITSY